MRSKYADSERGCAEVGQYKCGLVGESAQTWGKRVIGCGGFAWQKQINLLVVAIFVAET